MNDHDLNDKIAIVTGGTRAKNKIKGQ